MFFGGNRLLILTLFLSSNVLCLSILTGNALVLTSWVLSKQCRTPVGYLLANLAVCNLFSLSRIGLLGFELAGALGYVGEIDDAHLVMCNFALNVKVRQTSFFSFSSWFDDVSSICGKRTTTGSLFIHRNKLFKI